MRNGARPLEIPPEAIQKLRITSRFKEVQFPRKNSPRETELRIFSELKLNLGGKVCKTLEPLNRCSSLPNTCRD